MLFQVYFESDDVHACIVTCGGLCPGLNTVIREIVCGLHHMYGVKKVLGIDVSDYYNLCFNTFCIDLIAAPSPTLTERERDK
jgi:hypothetical protein